MTDHGPGPGGGRATVCFDRERVEALLKALEAALSGRTDAGLAVSAGEDVLDTIAHAIHTLHAELQRADVRANLAQEEKRAAIARAEARHGAMLRAMPDLMFVLLRDGTYVDYHARDPRLLFAPPGSFVGRTVREILPPAGRHPQRRALHRRRVRGRHPRRRAHPARHAVDQPGASGRRLHVA